MSLRRVNKRYKASKRSNTNHSPVCNESHQRILWKQAQAHDQRLFQRGQTVLLLASIDHIEEDWSARRRAREAVFNGSVLRSEFGRNGSVADILVVWWERIARQAEGADPKAGTNINLTEAKLAGSA